MNYSFLDRHGQYSADYLGLSLAGAVKLAPYSEECHAQVIDCYTAAVDKKKISVRDPLKFYIYLCNDYCANRYIDPDYPAMARLANQHAVDAQTPVYLPPDQRVTVKPQNDAAGNAKSTRNPYKEIPSTYKEIPSTYKEIPSTYKEIP